MAILFSVVLATDMASPLPLVISVVFAVGWILIWPSLHRRQMDALIAKLMNEATLDSYVGTHHAAFRDDVITCRYPGGYTETTYASIIRAAETADHVFLYNSPMTAIILPKRFLPGEVLDFIHGRWPHSATVG